MEDKTKELDEVRGRSEAHIQENVLLKEKLEKFTASYDIERKKLDSKILAVLILPH